jgi:hypothetical protein
LHIQTHKESRLTTEELLEVAFSLQSNPKFYKEDKSLLGTKIHESCVEAGSNTSTVALRVVGGSEKGTQCLGV